MNTDDVCLMVLEYAAKHQHVEVFHVLYKDKQQTPLPDVLLVPVVVYHIVSRGQTGRFEVAASLLDQLYQHDQTCCSFRKFFRLLLGIKMKMLLEVLREDSDNAMVKLNKHIPRQGYAYNTEDEQGLTKMNTSARTFRKFYLPLILEPEDRGRYFTEEYEAEFGQGYMESLQKLTQSVIANIVAWLSPCRLEVLVSKRNEVPADAYPRMCPAFKTLLEVIRVREKLDGEALMHLLKLLHDKDQLPARAREKMKSVAHIAPNAGAMGEDIDSPVENILRNTGDLKLDFSTTVSESLAPIIYTHLLYKLDNHRQELMVKQDKSRDFLRKLRNDLTLTNTKTVEAKKVAEKGIKHGILRKLRNDPTLMNTKTVEAKKVAEKGIKHGILRKLRNDPTLMNTKTVEAKKVADKGIKHGMDTMKCKEINAEVYSVKKHSHKRVKDTIADERRRSVDKSKIDVDQNEKHGGKKKAAETENHSAQKIAVETENHSAQKIAVETENHSAQKIAVETENHSAQKIAAETENHSAQKIAAETENHSAQKKAAETENHSEQKKAVETENHSAQKKAVETENHSAQKIAVETENHSAQKKAVETENHSEQKKAGDNEIHSEQKKAGDHENQSEQKKAGDNENHSEQKKAGDKRKLVNNKNENHCQKRKIDDKNHADYVDRTDIHGEEKDNDGDDTDQIGDHEIHMLIESQEKVPRSSRDVYVLLERLPENHSEQKKAGVNENHSDQKKAGDHENHSEQKKAGDKRKLVDNKNENHCQKRKIDDKNHPDYVDRTDIHGEEKDNDGDDTDQIGDHEIQMLTVSQEKEPRSSRDVYVLLERLPENHSEQKKAGNNENHSEQKKAGDKRKLVDIKNENHCQKRKIDDKNHPDYVDRTDIHGEEKDNNGDDTDQIGDHEIQMLIESQEKEPRSSRDVYVLLERLPEEKSVKKKNTDEESPDLLQSKHFYGLETPEASDNTSGHESDFQEERTQKLFHRKCGKKKLRKRQSVVTRLRNRCCSRTRRENFYTACVRDTGGRRDVNSHHVTIKPQSNFIYNGKEKLVPQRRRFLGRRCKNIERGTGFSQVEYTCNQQEVETNQKSELNMLSSQINSKTHTNLKCTDRSKPVQYRSKSLSRQCKTVGTASDKGSDMCVLEDVQTKKNLFLSELKLTRRQSVPNSLDLDQMWSNSTSDLDPNSLDRKRSAADMEHDEDSQDLMDSSAESVIFVCATNEQSKSSVAKATQRQKECASFLDLDRDQADDTGSVYTRKKARFRSSTGSIVGDGNEFKGFRDRSLAPERMNEKCSTGRSKALDASEQSKIKLIFHDRNKENIFNKKWRKGIMLWKRQKRNNEQEDEVCSVTHQRKATKGSNKDSSSHPCEKCDDTDTESDKYQSSKLHVGDKRPSEDSEKLLCKVNHTKVTCAKEQDTIKGIIVTKNAREKSDKLDPLLYLTHYQKHCQDLLRISESQDKLEDSDKWSANVDTPDDCKSPAAATTATDLSLLFRVDQVPNPEGTSVDALVETKCDDSDVGVVVPPSVRSEDCSDIELDMLEDSLEFEDNKISETVPDIRKFLHT